MRIRFEELLEENLELHNRLFDLECKHRATPNGNQDSETG